MAIFLSSLRPPEGKHCGDIKHSYTFLTIILNGSECSFLHQHKGFQQQQQQQRTNPSGNPWNCFLTRLVNNVGTLEGSCEIWSWIQRRFLRPLGKRGSASIIAPEHKHSPSHGSVPNLLLLYVLRGHCGPRGTSFEL